MRWSRGDRSNVEDLRGRAAPRGERRVLPVVADGRGAVHFTRSRDHAGLWMYDLRAGRETELRSSPEGQYEFDVAGDRLLFTQQAGPGRIFAMALRYEAW